MKKSLGILSLLIICIGLVGEANAYYIPRNRGNTNQYSQYSQYGNNYYNQAQSYQVTQGNPLGYNQPIPPQNGNMQVNVYYVMPQTPISTFGGYPGCRVQDIVIGGQIWASCNALSKNTGSDNQSGWFFGGDVFPSFVSANGIGQALAWQGQAIRTNDWSVGPCARGYRIPTRGEWETANYYARLNNTSIANLLNLPQNGSYQGYRDANYNAGVNALYDVSAGYWSSSWENGNTPIIMHLSSSYAGYRTDGTDFGYVNQGYTWQNTGNGLSLVQGTTQEVANIRCIRQ